MRYTCHCHCGHISLLLNVLSLIVYACLRLHANRGKKVLSNRLPKLCLFTISLITQRCATLYWVQMARITDSTENNFVFELNFYSASIDRWIFFWTRIPLACDGDIGMFGRITFDYGKICTNNDLCLKKLNKSGNEENRIKNMCCISDTHNIIRFHESSSRTAKIRSQ